MTLQDLGVYAPLKHDHPIIQDRDMCWICGRLFQDGDRVALRPYQTAEQVGGMAVRAKPVCATCHLRGTPIQTPHGPLIVDRILPGTDNITPVLTTNGCNWSEDQVGPMGAEKENHQNG